MATGGKDKMLLIKVAGAGLALLVAIVLLLQYTGAIGGGPSTPVPTAEQKAANDQLREQMKKELEESKAAGGGTVGG
jgi:hypothetical protein